MKRRECLKTSPPAASPGRGNWDNWSQGCSEPKRSWMPGKANPPAGLGTAAPPPERRSLTSICRHRQKDRCHHMSPKGAVRLPLARFPMLVVDSGIAGIFRPTAEKLAVRLRCHQGAQVSIRSLEPKLSGGSSGGRAQGEDSSARGLSGSIRAYVPFQPRGGGPSGPGVQMTQCQGG